MAVMLWMAVEWAIGRLMWMKVVAVVLAGWLRVVLVVVEMEMEMEVGRG
jgi:hypothetical protein